MQERLAELKTEEREVAAQLTWKVLVEEPPVVNGPAPPAEQPKPLQWPQPTEQPAKKPENEDEEEDEEELTPTGELQELRVTEEQLEEESAELSVSAKELKVDPVEDPFTSMMSTASTLSAAWPQNDTVRHYGILKHVFHLCGFNIHNIQQNVMECIVLRWCFQESSLPAVDWELKAVEMKQQASTTKVSGNNGLLIVTQ